MPSPTNPPPTPAAALVPLVAQAGLLDVVVGDVVGETVVTTELGPTVPTTGNTLGTGTAGVELTPRLPISKDPKGIPVRAPPPGAVGAVEVGLEDAARLLEPDPHIPDIPDVSNTPGDPVVTGNSDVTGVAGDVDVVDIADIAPAPEFAAVEGVTAATPIPPPSKLAVEPNISEGEVAAVEHAVALVVVGIVIVPVVPIGTGLTPGDVISVAPSGIPAGEPPEPVAMPRGEVAPIVSVGVVSVPSNCPSTCATATLQTKSAGRTAAIIENFIDVLTLWGERSRGKNQQRQIFNFLSITASNFCCVTPNVVCGRRQESVWLEEGAHRAARSNLAARLSFLLIQQPPPDVSDKSRGRKVAGSPEQFN